ncbi:site-specific integrase [Salinibacillus aidingensis]|uniref:Site-specific integrase n=1 Tax=Salinibacillus aidingensis TaxID=237684 RepID=A0ABP3LP66_9BACI
MTVIIMNKPNLDPFYNKDIFDLKEHPSSAVREKVQKRKQSLIDLSKLNEPLKLELKYYLQEVLLKQISRTALSGTYLTPLFHLIDFFSQISKGSSLHSFSVEVENEYRNYLLKKGVSVEHSIHGKSVHLKIYERAYLYVNDLYNGDNPFDKDIWKLDEMGIDASRNVESNKRQTITFHTIPNAFNRKVAKKYLKYLISTTDKAISTVYTKYNNIKAFLIFLDDKELTEIKRNHVEGFIENLNKRELKNETFNQFIFLNTKFVEYLIVNGYLSSNPFYSKDIKSASRDHNYKAVDDSVIKQIFSVLDQIPFQESCMYLLLYSTGLRVSEVCSIKVSSLFKNEEGFFVRFYSQKMRKEAVNPIPKSLYELLSKQQQTVRKKHGAKIKYLFPNSNLESYVSGTFRERMQGWFKELEIRKPNGSLYLFKPHDYRHTLATTMILNDIPSSVVQKVLHHDSIEMSASYIDILDQQKIKKHKDFINIKGESMPIHIDTSIDIDDLARIEWLKKSINAQMLPNGMCSLPVAMGKCPHANSCLTCGEFRTSKEFLPIHKKHYESVCSLIDYAKQQGWQRQVETNEEVKDNLETIIEKLQDDNEVLTS